MCYSVNFKSSVHPLHRLLVASILFIDLLLNSDVFVLLFLTRGNNKHLLIMLIKHAGLD